MPDYLPDSDANLLQAVINKKHLSWGISSSPAFQQIKHLSRAHSGWKLHASFSLPQRKSKLFKYAYLNRVLLFCRRSLYNIANVNFYVNNSNVCIAVAIKNIT